MLQVHGVFKYTPPAIQMNSDTMMEPNNYLNEMNKLK